MKSLIEQLQAGGELDRAQVDEAVAMLVREDITLEQRAEFLSALHAKGETAGEMAAFVEALLGRAISPELEPEKLPGPMIDLCGTGGDRLQLFNISTTSMFVVAAAGAVVVKHGNRGVTSQCGGADVLEKLGVCIDLPPADFRRCLETNGAGFLFAPLYHPAFKVIAPVRRLLADRGETTVFNLLGPLLNPARPAYQLAGVFDAGRVGKYAEVMRLLGREKAWAVHGEGADELMPFGTALVAETAAGVMREFTLATGECGFALATLADLRGGDCAANAAILNSILAGEERGPKRDAVLLNAAAALVVCGVASNLPIGLALAQTQIENGGAIAKLRALQDFC